MDLIALLVQDTVQLDLGKRLEKSDVWLAAPLTGLRRVEAADPLCLTCARRSTFSLLLYGCLCLVVRRRGNQEWVMVMNLRRSGVSALLTANATGALAC